MKSAAAHYCRRYFTGHSEHCDVAVWPRGGHPTETDQRSYVISLVMTLTGNPPENTHSENRITVRPYCLFGNSMEYSGFCDVIIE